MDSFVNDMKVVAYDECLASEWKSFLDHSENETIFHDLDFLDSYLKQESVPHHLVVYDHRNVVALFPSIISVDINGSKSLKSPGISRIFGGIVTKSGLPGETPVRILCALQDYARAQDIDTIEVRIANKIYNGDSTDLLSFAYMASGFTLVRRWLSMAIPLQNEETPMDCILSKRRRTKIRSSLRKGLTVEIAGVERLAEFYEVLLKTNKRHNTSPVHDFDELEELLLRYDCLKVFACCLNGEIIGGVLVCEINIRVAYALYICHDEEHSHLSPPSIAIFKAVEYYKENDFSYLDLGACGFAGGDSLELRINSGGFRFKRQMGARPCCTDMWRWSANSVTSSGLAHAPGAG